MNYAATFLMTFIGKSAIIGFHLLPPSPYLGIQPVEGAMAIDVHVNKLYDAGTSTPDPGMRHHLSIVQKRKGPSKCLPCTVLIVER